MAGLRLRKRNESQSQRRTLVATLTTTRLTGLQHPIWRLSAPLLVVLTMALQGCASAPKEGDDRAPIRISADDEQRVGLKQRLDDIQWKPEEQLGLQFHYFEAPSPKRKGPTTVHPTRALSFGNPPYQPDQGNVSYQRLLELGYPLPSIPSGVSSGVAKESSSQTGPSKWTVFQKYYEFPQALQTRFAESWIDQFHLNLVPRSGALQDMARDPKKIAVVYNLPAPRESLFSVDKPFPHWTLPVSSAGEVQDRFEKGVRFASVYIATVNNPPDGGFGTINRELELAHWSTLGLVAFHAQLTKALEKQFKEISGAHGAHDRYFVTKRDCSWPPAMGCKMEVLKIPREALRMVNAKQFPLPHDPEHLFLSGLAVLHLNEYRLKENGHPFSNMIIDSEEFSDLFETTRSQVFELRSVVKL